MPKRALIFEFKYYYEYNNKNAIIKANRPVASDSANPKIAYANNCGLRAGFLEVAVIKPENTIPIPTPAPANPIVAKPAPMYFAAANIFHKNMNDPRKIKKYIINLA